MNTKLYYHKTDGGAEYLCTSPVKGTDEGDLYTTIIRLDGEPELMNPAIAAWSELLDSLRDCVEFIENEDWDGEEPQFLAIARAAIAKATGE